MLTPVSSRFIKDSGPLTGCDAFLMLIPMGIQTKRGLLNAFAATGYFPDYFGHNWDALFDFLTDFNWIAQRIIVIRHGDIPLSNDTVECSRYLSVIAEAQKYWEDTWKTRNLRVAGWKDHQLKIVFPTAANTIIETILR